MSELRCLPKKFLFEFIELYKGQTCLWKVKSPEYKDRVKKTLAYKELLTKLQQREPAATEEDVRRKINSIRTVFRREHRRVIETRGYTPSLCYYGALLFLIEQDLPKRQSYANFDDIDDEDCGQSTEVSSLGDIAENLNEYNINIEESKRSDSRDHSFTSKISSQRSIKRKREKVLRIITGKMPKQEEVSLEYENFGRHIAEEMRKLPKEQAILLVKIVSIGIFEAQTGALTKKTKIVSNPDCGK